MSVDSPRAALDPEPASDPDRSAAQIERDIDQRRQRLVTTVDEITIRVAPAAMAQNAKNKAINLIKNPHTGSLRVERVLPVVGVVAGAVALLVVRKATHRPTRKERVLAQGQHVADNANELRDKLVELLGHAADVARVRANQAWDATADARSKAGDVTSQAAEQTRHTAESARDHVAQATQNMSETVTDATTQGNEKARNFWKKKATKRFPWS